MGLLLRRLDGLFVCFDFSIWRENRRRYRLHLANYVNLRQLTAWVYRGQVSRPLFDQDEGEQSGDYSMSESLVWGIHFCSIPHVLLLSYL